MNIGTIPEVEIKNDSGSPIPVTGTVNIGTIPEVEIKNDSGSPIPVSGTVSVVEPVSVDDNGGSLTVDQLGVSAFGTGLASTVTGAATLVAAAGARQGLVLQNLGVVNVRLGSAAVTATTGMRLVPNQTLIFTYPDTFTGAVYAIREGAVNGTVFAQILT